MKIEQRKCHGYDYAVFHIPINDGMVYMKQRLQPSDEDCYFVIFVDRYRFESVWFKGGSGVAPELARGNEKAWRKDYKFHHAERGFSHGIENPVPLAVMQANYDYPRVGFTDGITRTVWLLANGAKNFPLFAFNKKTAEYLYKYIGIKGSKVFSNNELITYLNDGLWRK
ncbi:plasmid fertility inhibition factor family protein [Vibrio ichthyoenteri]|nr:hypothetical protein [Vibrio ichthyoenteri]